MSSPFPLLPPTSSSPPPASHTEKDPSFAIELHASMLTMAKAGNLDQKFKVVEDRSRSECCSGCQSGWTHYLEHSQSLQPKTESSVFQEEEDEDEEKGEEEEEDMSMISDASSGPPHVSNDEENCCSDGEDGFLHVTRLPENGCKRRRIEEEEEEEEISDSASSTLISITKAINSTNCRSKKLFLMEDEQSSFSSTHFK